jgi:peptidoglycan hydrolase-like protein with peptidoglycan-binding domain
MIPDRWHLMKHDDGTVFGPVTFEAVKAWAQAAQVSPLDKVSEDQQNWIKAPMFAELEMDWLLQMSDDHYYGPTTLSAIQEFIKEGEIDNDTCVINCKDGTKMAVGELPFRKEKDEEDGEDGEKSAEDGALEERVAALEKLAAQQKDRIDDLEALINDFLAPR